MLWWSILAQLQTMGFGVDQIPSQQRLWRPGLDCRHQCRNHPGELAPVGILFVGEHPDGVLVRGEDVDGFDTDVQQECEHSTNTELDGEPGRARPLLLVMLAMSGSVIVASVA